MFSTQFRSVPGKHARPGGVRQRRVALLASGRRYGSITRLITPWGIGELTQPFLLLNYAEIACQSRPLFRIHPPSSTTAMAIVLNGQLSFEDATGKRGKVDAGGLAWMRAGGAVWHEGASASHEPLRVFQLWITQPAAQQSSVAASECIAPDEVEVDGPVRVLLGQFGRARSRISRAAGDINCLQVHLEDGQRFRYAAPDGHNVTWLAVDRGGLLLAPGERVYWEQIALFGDSSGVIEAQADGDTSFILGSARRHASEVPLEFSLNGGSDCSAGP
jgi:redox-sensitive bicupin YhaK (pirin superfamily)